LELRFTKGAGKVDRLEIVRDAAPAGAAPEQAAHGEAASAEAGGVDARAGGAEHVEIIECPKQRIIPHDMVHYAVEVELREGGFLQRVAEGEAAGFTMTPTAQSDAIERLVEVFQGDAWSPGTTDPQAMLDLYAVTCVARECLPLNVDVTVIQRIRERIAVLTRRWEAIAVGGTLTLTF
jgi:hypothetical protein